MYLLEKFDPSRPVFKSLKVIGTDTDRSATYDFLLVCHSNCTVSEINSYLQNFPTLVYLTSAAEGVPLGILISDGAKKSQ